MHFLDARGLQGGDDDRRVASAREGLSGIPRHPDDPEPARPRGPHRLEDVLRAPARRHRDEQISPASQRLDLAGEDTMESQIVSGGGERRDVGAQRDGGQRTAIADEPHHELRGEMLGLGRAPPVPAEEHGAPVREGGSDEACHAVDGIHLAGEDREKRGGAFGKDAADSLGGGCGSRAAHAAAPFRTERRLR